MGWKYDKNTEEWITTEEYNSRQLGWVLVVVALVAIIIGPILPARLLKWLFGHGFWPSPWSLWQYFIDLLISLPIYAVIAGAVLAIKDKAKGE